MIPRILLSDPIYLFKEILCHSFIYTDKGCGYYRSNSAMKKWYVMLLLLFLWFIYNIVGVSRLDYNSYCNLNFVGRSYQFNIRNWLLNDKEIIISCTKNLNFWLIINTYYIHISEEYFFYNNSADLSDAEFTAIVSL